MHRTDISSVCMFVYTYPVFATRWALKYLIFWILNVNCLPQRSPAFSNCSVATDQQLSSDGSPPALRWHAWNMINPKIQGCGEAYLGPEQKNKLSPTGCTDQTRHHLDNPHLNLLRFLSLRTSTLWQGFPRWCWKSDQGSEGRNLGKWHVIANGQISCYGI